MDLILLFSYINFVQEVLSDQDSHLLHFCLQQQAKSQDTLGIYSCFDKPVELKKWHKTSFSVSGNKWIWLQSIQKSLSPQVTVLCWSTWCTSCHCSCQRITGDWGCIWCRRVSGDISGQNYCGVTFKVAKVCISVHHHCHSSVQEIDNASGLLE